MTSPLPSPINSPLISRSITNTCLGFTFNFSSNFSIMTCLTSGFGKSFHGYCFTVDRISLIHLYESLVEINKGSIADKSFDCGLRVVGLSGAVAMELTVFDNVITVRLKKETDFANFLRELKKHLESNKMIRETI